MPIAFPHRGRAAAMFFDIGVLLERLEGSGLLIVKGLKSGGDAEIDGRICINDTLLKVPTVSSDRVCFHVQHDCSVATLCL